MKKLALAIALLGTLGFASAKRSSSVTVIQATADLGWTYQGKNLGDAAVLDGSDIQAAICNAACNTRCAIELLEGTYVDVEAYFPETRNAGWNATICDRNTDKNECARLGYTGMTGESQYIEVFGQGRGRTIVKLKDRDATYDATCVFPGASSENYHLRGAFTVRELSEGIWFHDFSIDGRLSEQPAPPSNDFSKTSGMYIGIIQSRSPSASLTPWMAVTNVEIRNIVANALVMQHVERGLVSGVKIDVNGVHKTETGHVNPAWASVTPAHTTTSNDITPGIGLGLYGDTAGAGKITVRQCTFDDNSKYGIVSLSSNGVTIKDSTFRDNRVGIEVGYFPSSPYTKNITIKDNTFTSGGFSTDVGSGSSLTGTGIAVINQGTPNIPAGTVERLVLADNNFVANDGPGIQFIASDTSSGEVVEIKGNTVNANCLRGNEFECHPIQITGNDTSVSDLVYQDNTINASVYAKYGLSIGNVTNFTMGTGNTVNMSSDNPGEWVLIVNESANVTLGNALVVGSVTNRNAILFNQPNVTNSTVAAGVTVNTTATKCHDGNPGGGNSFDATACGITPSLLLQNIVGATRNIDANDAAPNGSFEIANDGSSGSSVNYTVSVDASPDVCDGVSKTNWITATGTGNVLKGGTPATIALTYDTAACVAGTYNGTVRVTSTNADDSPKTIAITLVVTAASGPLLVNAGGPYSCEACTSIPISCIAADGTPPYTTYLWEWQSQTGPCASAAITSTSSASTTITGLVSSYDATCQIKCTVTDTDTNQASDIDGVTVNPTPLQASLSNVSVTGTTGNLQGSCSGGDGTYQWTVIEKSGGGCADLTWTGGHATCAAGTTSFINTPFTWGSVNPTRSCTVELTCDDTGVQACP